jgi:hypothetical protein
VSGAAGSLTGDLAIDPTGRQRPSMVAAGYAVPAALDLPPASAPHDSPLPAIAVAVMAGSLLVAAAVGAVRGRRTV